MLFIVKGIQNKSTKLTVKIDFNIKTTELKFFKDKAYIF